jgi:hypothetical protein
VFARNLAQIAHRPADERQCLEVVDARILWGEEREDQIDRLAVDRIEIERLFQTQENPDDARQILEAGMGQGNAMPHACGPKAFPLLQTVDGRRRVQPVSLRCDLTKFLKQALLARQVSDDPHGPRLQ